METQLRHRCLARRWRLSFGAGVIMSATEIDFYEVLGVSRDADGAAIKAAYRKLAMQYHPGPQRRVQGQRGQVQGGLGRLRMPQGPAEARRLRPVRPCGVPERRRPGRPGQPTSATSATSSRRSSAARSAAAGQQARRGADLRYDMEVTLDEAFHGESKQIEIEVSQTCEHLPRLGRLARHLGAALQLVLGPRQGPRQAGLLRGRARRAPTATGAAR